MVKPFRQCETKWCLLKQRHRRALWLIDGVPHCNGCYEAWIEDNFVEEHRIVRLSDNNRDFEWSVARAPRKNACKERESRLASPLQA
jgi:hypothetical protein